MTTHPAHPVHSTTPIEDVEREILQTLRDHESAPLSWFSHLPRQAVAAAITALAGSGIVSITGGHLALDPARQARPEPPPAGGPGGKTAGGDVTGGVHQSDENERIEG